MSFKTLVMSHKLSPESDDIESKSDETYTYERTNTQGQLAQMSANIVQIEKLKVGWAQIDQAVIGSLEANGINADWITAGKFTSEDENGKSLELGAGIVALDGGVIENIGVARQVIVDMVPVTYTGEGVSLEFPIGTGNYATGLFVGTENGLQPYTLIVYGSGNNFKIEHTINGAVALTGSLSLNGTDVQETLDSKMPVIRLTGMSGNTISDLLQAMNDGDSLIPLGPSVVYLGDSTVTRRAMVQCFKTNSTLGRGLIISPYAINGTYITLGANGWTT